MELGKALIYTEGEGTASSLVVALLVTVSASFRAAELENDGPQFLVDHLQYEVKYKNHLLREVGIERPESWLRPITSPPKCSGATADDSFQYLPHYFCSGPIGSRVSRYLARDLRWFLVTNRRAFSHLSDTLRELR